MKNLKHQYSKCPKCKKSVSSEIICSKCGSNLLRLQEEHNAKVTYAYMIIQIILFIFMFISKKECITIVNHMYSTKRTDISTRIEQF